MKRFLLLALATCFAIAGARAQSDTAPVITAHPANTTASVGGGASFTVAATAVPAPTYQWKHNGLPLAGATATTLSLSNVTLANAGAYTVTVRNAVGAVTSNPALLTGPNAAPTITTHPTSTTITAGQPLTLTVAASGSGLNYFWRHNGAVIPGATTATYSTGATRGMDGLYDVLVANGLSIAVSNAARVNVAPTQNVDVFYPVPNFVPRFEAPTAALSAWLTLADGRSLVAGTFTSVHGVPRTQLALINADGSLASWMPPSLNGAVNFLTLQPDGKILVGGGFTRVAGKTVGGLFRLTSSLEFDGAFDIGAGLTATTGTARACAGGLQSDGKIIVGGNFTHVAGTARTNLARLNTNGSVDTTFDASANTLLQTGSVLVLRVLPDDRIFAAGEFLNMFMRLAANGAADATFSQGATAYNGSVTAVAPASGGKLMLVGFFIANATDFQPRQHLVRINADGSLDTTFTVPLSTPIAVGGVPMQVAVDASNRVYVGARSLPTRRLSASGVVESDFTVPWASNYRASVLFNRADGSIFTAGSGPFGRAMFGTQTISSDGTAASAFVPVFPALGPARVSDIVQQPDGRLLIGGEFAAIDGVSRPGLARLNRDGTLDASFNPALAGTNVSRFVRLGNGNILVAGFDGSFVRLTPTGAVDPAFNPGSGVGLFGVDRQGRIYTDGGGVVRLLPNGAVDDDFVRVTTSFLQTTFTLADDGRLYFGGIQTIAPDGSYLVNGQSTLLSRFAPDGSFDSAFRVIPPSAEHSSLAGPLVRTASGQMIVGRFVPAYPTEPSLVRLSTAGVIDSTYVAPAAVSLPRTSALAVLPDGRIYRAGGGITRHLATGALDPAFQSTVAVGDAVGLALRDDGTLLIATGGFDDRGGLVLLGPAAAPSIITSPVIQGGVIGGSATFSVVVAGTPMPTFQWLRNGVELAGKTEPVLTLTNLQASDFTNYSVRITNASGTITTTPVALVQATAPTITTQPATKSVNVGQTATFSVVATGTPTPTYQWRKGTTVLVNGAKYSGVNTATLTISNAQEADAGGYNVVVSTAAGTISSDNAGLGVLLAGLMNLSIRHRVDAAGVTAWFTIEGNASKTVLVRGIGPSLASFGMTGVLADPRLSLWNPVITEEIASNDDWIPSSALNNATFLVGTFPLVADSKDAALVVTLNPGTYEVRLTGANSSSGTALLEIYDADTARGSIFTYFAARATVGTGADALIGGFFHRTASPRPLLVRGMGPSLNSPTKVANPTLTVQQASTVIGANDNWAGDATVAAAAATLATVPFASTASQDAALVASFGDGGHIAQVDTTTGPGTGLLEIFDPSGSSSRRPYLILYPASQTVARGANVTFAVQAAGTPPLSYQWSHNPPLTVTATQPTLTVNNVQFSDGGSYSVAVTNVLGTGGQTSAVLTVVGTPQFTTHPAAATVLEGSPVTFQAVAVGSPAPTYQWRRNGAPLSNATNASYSIGAVSFASAGTYDVLATNSNGSTLSNPALLTVHPSPVTGGQHGIVGAGYRPGTTVTIANMITYPAGTTSAAWQVLLPDGWSYVSSSGDAGTTQPAVGATGTIEHSWTTLPPSPVRFRYTLNVPAGATGDHVLAALVTLQTASGSTPLMAKPDPLPVTPLTKHSADVDGDNQINLLELTRVIELYNTRLGTARTGAYRNDATGEDGFAPDSTGAAALGVLTRNHNSDTDRDGRISLLELTRVIELFNYRQGTTRTGQYRVQDGTEDGFAPGP